MAIALAFVPQAAARPEPKAKFKVVSASGREALSFQEEGTTRHGQRCLAITLKRLRLRR